MLNEARRYVLGVDELFSNGFRYVNWSIDVPILLTQLLVIAELTRRQAWSTAVQFIAFGLLMIYTGYLGQFYEVTNHGMLWLWGVISTVFYLYLLYLVWRTTESARASLPERTKGWIRIVQGLILVSWSLYPVAYIMPVIWDDA